MSTVTAADKDPAATPPEGKGRFSELDELQREIAQRIKDNQRFLEGFLSDDYDDDTDEAEDDSTDFEEL
jgi:Mn-dependent DtxR family transcriptional regulator